MLAPRLPMPSADEPFSHAFGESHFLEALDPVIAGYAKQGLHFEAALGPSALEEVHQPPAFIRIGFVIAGFCPQLAHLHSQRRVIHFHRLSSAVGSSGRLKATTKRGN